MSFFLKSEMLKEFECFEKKFLNSFNNTVENYQTTMNVGTTHRILQNFVYQ